MKQSIWTRSQGTTRWRRRILKAVTIPTVLVGLALGLAACGGGSPNAAGDSGSSTSTTTASSTGGGGASQSGSSSASKSAIAFASCVRAHGEPNFPDSAVTVDGGRVTFHITSQDGVNPNSSQFQVAMNACRKDLPGGTSSGGTSSAHQAQLLKWVQCLRTHGIPNFPEPNAQGGIIVRGGSGSGLDPNSPQFQQAMQDCKSLEPSGLSG